MSALMIALPRRGDGDTDLESGTSVDDMIEHMIGMLDDDDEELTDIEPYVIQGRDGRVLETWPGR